MGETSVFQKIILGVFFFIIIIGVGVFAFQRSTNQAVQNGPVVLWGTISSNDMDAMTEALRNNKEEITVEYREIPEDQFLETVVEALATGKGPDVVVVPSDLIVQFSDKLFRIPYETLPERTFRDTFVEQGELYLDRDGVIAVPFMIDPLVMYWNRDILSTAGLSKPPTLWSEMPNFVSRVVRTDGTRTIYQAALALGEFANIAHAKDILQALMLQAGNPVVVRGEDYDGNISFKPVMSEGYNVVVNASQAALDFFVQYSDPSRSVYTWNRSLRPSTEAFIAGELGLYFGYASELEVLREKNPNLNYDVALLPQGNPTGGNKTFAKMYALGITSNSVSPESAYNAVQKLTSPVALTALAERRVLPPVRRDMLADIPQNFYAPVFYSSALASRGVLDIDPEQTTPIFKEMIESVLSSRSRVGEAVNKAQAQMEVLVAN